MKIIIIAEVPDKLGNEYCQFVSAFGMAHPGCKLNIFAVDPNKSVGEIKEILNIMPELSIIKETKS